MDTWRRVINLCIAVAALLLVIVLITAAVWYNRFDCFVAIAGTIGFLWKS
jgi:hypothetical protein